MDIDHVSYVEGIVLYDKTGKLEEWRKNSAYYPLETHSDRLKAKWINLVVSFGYVQKNKIRGNDMDMKVNLFKTLTICGNLCFNLLKTWVPPTKWWSKYAIKYGIDEPLFKLYTKAVQDLTVESTKELISTMKERIIKEGINLDNFEEDFFETIYPEGRSKLIKYSYF